MIVEPPLPYTEVSVVDEAADVVDSADAGTVSSIVDVIADPAALVVVMVLDDVTMLEDVAVLDDELAVVLLVKAGVIEEAGVGYVDREPPG